jgi:hypothetical protein
MSTQLFKSTLQQKHADDREKVLDENDGLDRYPSEVLTHPLRIQLKGLPAAGEETIQAQVPAVAEAE